jgi:hypothetical protein
VDADDAHTRTPLQAAAADHRQGVCSPEIGTLGL